MTPALVLALFRTMIENYELEAPQALLDLVRLLARSHATMDNGDWETIAMVGALAWRAEMKHMETLGQFQALMNRLQGGI